PHCARSSCTSSGAISASIRPAPPSMPSAAPRSTSCHGSCTAAPPMAEASVFSRRTLVGLIAAAALLFLSSLFLMSRGEGQGGDAGGRRVFSRPAMGYAGLAERPRGRDVRVVKSKYNAAGKLSPGGVLVAAEPLPPRPETLRPLREVRAALLILPKWQGRPSR